MKTSLPGKTAASSVNYEISLLSDDDIHLFNEGNHLDLADKLGSHPTTRSGQAGTSFAVWAPNAKRVSVVGEFNDWNKGKHPLQPRGSSGIWEGFIPDVGRGTLYKYHIESHEHQYRVDKADPFARMHEIAPNTASVVWEDDYQWNDAQWLAHRKNVNRLDKPMSTYEVHVGSWRRVAEDGWRSLSYRELAHQLVDYIQPLGFTHVEFMPVMEHPFFGSWGYQVTGFFAPSSRYGTPEDFKYLIDYLHQHEIGVILDWVPSHFPCDEHGLGYFDGTHLYEHADPRQGFHPDWNSFIFNYGRNEVRSFLLSNALFWLKEFHIDGLRVDAVASMLYLDYSREQGEWIPNEFGGRENLPAISFMRQLNRCVYERFPDTQTIAEESTAWPMVSRPAHLGGLGFGLKWDMGWMHDTLKYLSHDPIHRQYHHGQLTFRTVYAFNENFVMPLSHDEVVHGKGSLYNKMPGDAWQKLANLRLLIGYMYAQPGKKLLFMGGEIGQHSEWQHDGQLSWDLLEEPGHAALQQWVGRVNEWYRREPALHERDCEPTGFEWIDANDSQGSTLSFLRCGFDAKSRVLVVINFTPVPRYNYRVGVPLQGFWQEILNSDAEEHGGSGHGNLGGVDAVPVPFHGRPCSVNLTLPPLGISFFRYEG